MHIFENRISEQRDRSLPPPPPRHDTHVLFSSGLFVVPDLLFLPRNIDTGSLFRIRPRTSNDLIWLLQPPLTDIPAPAPQRLDHFRGDCGGQRDAEEDEGFVDGVGEGELRPDA